MKRFLPRQCNNEDIQPLVDCGYSQDIATALHYRNIDVDTLTNYREGVLCFHDAFAMPNMDSAVDSIQNIIDNNGSILIYGDYDADGLSASSLLSLYLTEVGADNDIVIPTREIGYGINVELVAKQYQHKWYDMIITVDCGISNHQEICQLREIFDDSIEIIVTDHHELPSRLPECICINPKMGYPYPYLSGSGVAYKLVEALSGGNCAKYLDLALIGTIADIMPMCDENRSIVKVGLDNFTHKGLIKLAELSRAKKPYTITDIAMRVAPKINASGRVGDVNDALQLLLSIDKADVVSANKLLQYNDNRRTITDQTYSLALSQCDSAKIARDKLVFVRGENWVQGVLGIVANKLKETYNCCAVVFNRDGDEYHGSARGIEGVNLFQLFDSCKEHLVKFGGHKASVGFTVHQDSVDKLYQCLVEGLSKLTLENNFIRYYDVAINDNNIMDLYQLEQLLQPIHSGDGFVYYIKDFVKYANTFGKGSEHVTLTLNCGLEVKVFGNLVNAVPVFNSGAEVEILCHLAKDSYSGNIQGTLLDIVLCNSLHYESLYVSNYFDNINFVNDNIEYIDESSAREMLIGDNVIVVADSYSQLCQCPLLEIDEYTVDYFVHNVTTSRAVVISPLDSNIVSNYNNVLVLVSDANMARLYQGDNVRYYLVQDDSMYQQLVISRDVCSSVYRALLAKSSFDTLAELYIKYLVGKVTKEQYSAVLAILQQLGTLKIVDKYNIILNKEVKVNLQDSTIFATLAK